MVVKKPSKSHKHTWHADEFPIHDEPVKSHCTKCGKKGKRKY
jgi:hypothetical protein